MTPYYLIHFLRKILKGNRVLDEMLEREIQIIKKGLKELFTKIGITYNKPHEID